MIMQKTTRVLVDVTGGVVQSILADGPVDVVVIDNDNDDIDDEDLDQVRIVNGHELYFSSATVERVDTNYLDPFFEAAMKFFQTVKAVP